VSLKSTARAMPVLLKIGFAEALAYRAEFFVWVLATTMPLVMLALFSTVASEGPLGRYGQDEIIAYFLSTFIVRQLTGSWAAWQMNFEVRQGTLSARLLRPVHPLFHYAAENLAALPMRLLVALPVAVIALVSVGRDKLNHDPVVWAALPLALLGGWLLTFLANVAIGSLSLWTESSLKMMDLWLVFFFVFSGYLIPVDLFPEALQRVVQHLPFRFQIGIGVEMMTGAHSRERALSLLAEQWAWVTVLLTVTTLLWSRGVARFSAYGG
jgi:ABC-2 type transport system permease protein